MTIQPPYKISWDFGATFVPVPQVMWKYFCTKDSAVALLPQLQALASDTQCYDWTGNFGPILIKTDASSNAAIWMYLGMAGTYTGGPVGMQWGLQEFAGALIDAQSNPRPFIDHPPCDHLVATPVDVGLVQVSWAK